MAYEARNYEGDWPLRHICHLLSVCLSLRYLWSPIRQENEKILMNATNTTEELIQIWATIIRSVRRRLFHQMLEKHNDM